MNPEQDVGSRTRAEADPVLVDTGEHMFQDSGPSSISNGQAVLK